ncbi:MAG: metallophosphoesterase [Lachnospiraceae bacterium]|nr:metallophosphoesterase [Lachnospiraceae bacterium]
MLKAGEGMEVWEIYVCLAIGAVIGALFCLDYLKRAYKTFLGRSPRKLHRIFIYVLSIGVGTLCLDIYGSGTVLLLYWFIPQVVLMIINFVVKKGMGEAYDEKGRIWKKVYGSGIVPVVIMAALVSYGWYNMHHVVATEYTIPTEKNIRDEGYRVVLMADIHYGTFQSEKELREKCEEINQIEPDMVFLCGDIVDEKTTKEKMEEVFEILSGIQCEYGFFYVYGNHDRQEYTSYPMFTNNELRNVMEQNGITVLQDELVVLNDEFVIVGREDSTVGGRASIKSLLENVDKTDFIVTLDHQPKQYGECAEAGADLHLAGHTHGGQIWPINYITKLTYEGFYGYKKTEEGMQTVVTSGFAGWAMGIKTSAPAEYVVLNIEGNGSRVSE